MAVVVAGPGVQCRAQATQTFSVVVDIGSYGGFWSGAGSQPFVQGGRTLNLPQGTHSFLVGGYAGFEVHIDPDGTLSTNKPESISIAGNVVSYRTAVVTIDPVAYAGQWGMDYSTSGWMTGLRSVTLVRDQLYGAQVGDYAGFRFRLAADGTVSIFDNAPAANASGATVTFNNTPVTIDPADYLGSGPTGTLATGRRV